MGLPQIEFKLRAWGVLKSYLPFSFAIIYLILSFVIGRQKMTSFDYYAVAFISLLVVFILIRDLNRYRFFIVGKPVFAVNQQFVYDLIRDLKFYWKDIEEITVYKGRWNAQLEIELRDPETYLNQWKKNRKPRKNDKDYVFVVDLSYVKVRSNDLERILQQYSDSPEDRERAMDANLHLD